MFHPKGAAVINAMEDYSREMHRKHHYSFVQTPHITKGGLYETSGHLQWYKDSIDVYKRQALRRADDLALGFEGEYGGKRHRSQRTML